MPGPIRLPVSLLCLLALSACRVPERSGGAPSDAVNLAWRADLEAADSLLASAQANLQAGPREGKVDTAALRQAFRQARLRYKRGEFLWEYAFPEKAARLNNPDEEEAEEPGGKDGNRAGSEGASATGFQALEARLYARPPAAAGEILARVRGLRALLADTAVVSASWSDSSLVEAMRIEYYRLAFLGTTSFDSPAALHSLPETRAALEGIAAAAEIRFGGNPAGRGALDRFRARQRAALALLEGPLDFASFDRAGFLRSGMEPLYAALTDLRAALSIPICKADRAYSSADRSLFAAAAWNPAFFAPADSQPGDMPARIELGRRLFFDPALSGNGTRSCAVCHAPELAFSDGRAKSMALDGHSPVARNTPTLIQAAFQRGAFADLRAHSLEEQAGMVIGNPAEMGGDLDMAARRLNADPGYASGFREAFADPDSPDRSGEPVSPGRIRRALAAYERTLASFASPWDRFVRGDSAAMTAEARRGFNLFMGKAECASCHFPPLFNGTRPPDFAETEAEVIGTPGRIAHGPGPRAYPDADSGRMAQDHDARSFRAFKTPTLRNVGYTAPYMHNGVFASLEEVVDFYAAGGGAGMGLDIPNQTLAQDSLHLDAAEKHALVAFLKALSDTAGTTARPAAAAKAYALGH